MMLANHLTPTTAHVTLRHHRRNSVAAAVCLLGMGLAGCGGGEDASSNQSTVVVVPTVELSVAGGSLAPEPSVLAGTPAGSYTIVSAQAVSRNTGIESITWTVDSPAGSAPAVISNANCAAGNRKDTLVSATTSSAATTNPAPTTNATNPATPGSTTTTTTTTPTTGASTTTTTQKVASSTWSCPVTISAPITLTKDANYLLTVVVKTLAGTTQSASRYVRFNAASAFKQTLGANAGGAIQAKARDVVDLACSAVGGKEPYTYRWSLVDQNFAQTIVLSAPQEAKTSFTAPDKSGSATFACVVTDADFSYDRKLVKVDVTKETRVLNVSTGPVLSAAPGDTVALECAVGNAVGAVTYSWTRSPSDQSGLALTLSEHNVQRPKLTLPATIAKTASLEFRCDATDSAGNSGFAIASVNASASPVPPPLSVNAGPDFNLPFGSTASLHCDATGGTSPYAYQWVITNSGNLPVALSSFNAADITMPAPTALIDTPVSLSCRVTDAKGTVSSDAVIATINPANTISIAIDGGAAKTSALNAAASFTVNVSNAGALESGLTYRWRQLSGPVLDLGGQTTKTLSVVPTTDGTYTFAVTVTSPTGATYTTQAVLSTTNGLFDLIIDGGASKSVVINTPATFTATLRGATLDGRVSYRWEQISGITLPVGGETTPSMSVTPTASGTYTFRLTATTQSGQVFTTLVVLVATDPPAAPGG